MRIKGSEILKSILLGVGITGLVFVAITAPNLFSAFGQLSGRKAYKKAQIRRAFDHARKSQMIEVKKTPSGYTVMLTKKGKERMDKFRLGELRLTKPKKWDGKWRIVVFDIPEKYKPNRLVFARKLKELGMAQMQKSVWVWPYDLQDEVALMKEAYEIRPFVRLITAQNIDRETDLYKFFNL